MIASDLRSGVECLGDMIAEAKRIVPFTGAGISTECGIPDFRSPGGIWTRNRPIPFDEFVASPEARDESWRRRFAMEEVFAAAKPGRGHRALAALYRAGKVPAIITQNIDNLHQASGFAAEHVIELHGNTTYARCIGCGQAYPLDWVKRRFDEAGAAPNCTACDEPVKTATISFGPDDARGRNAACNRFVASLRPLHRDRFLAGGMAGRGLSDDGEEIRCTSGDHQPGADRAGRYRRPRDPPRHRRNARALCR
ncbi:NAD-dependent deacetylase [Bradyrhizobium sp. LB7.1]